MEFTATIRGAVHEIQVTHCYAGRPAKLGGLPETWAPEEPSEFECIARDENGNQITLTDAELAEVERQYIQHCKERDH